MSGCHEEKKSCYSPRIGFCPLPTGKRAVSVKKNLHSFILTRHRTKRRSNTTDDERKASRKTLVKNTTHVDKSRHMCISSAFSVQRIFFFKTFCIHGQGTSFSAHIIIPPWLSTIWKIKRQSEQLHLTCPLPLMPAG